MKIAIFILAVLLFIIWIAVSKIAYLIKDYGERIESIENCLPYISNSLSSICDAIDALDKRTELLDDESLNDMMNGKENSVE